MRVYLAGPDVFRPDPVARGAALRAICAEAGLDAVFPLDEMRGGVPPAWRGLPAARRIALCNEAHIRGCVALIANLTPFRGPSADVGTAYEMGFARALGLPVFGWTADPRGYTERARAGATDALRDAQGMAIEAFGCVDNLMLDGAVAGSGGTIVGPALGAADELAAFRTCCGRVAAHLAGKAEQAGRGGRGGGP